MNCVVDDTFDRIYKKGRYKYLFMKYEHLFTPPRTSPATFYRSPNITADTRPLVM